MDHKQFLLDEYKRERQEPAYFSLPDGESVLMPCVYHGDKDAFVDDWLSFQNEELQKYDTHNAANPDNPIEIPEPLKYDDLYIFPPLKGVLKNWSEQKIINKALRTAMRKYKAAIKQTAQVAKIYPTDDFITSLNKDAVSRLKKLHNDYKKEKLKQNLARTFKFTAKQTANILAGATGALPAAAYYLLDKKVRFAKSKTKSFIDNKALPYIRRGAVKALIPLSVFAAAKITPVIKEAHQNKIEQQMLQAREQAEKEAFFAKYQTTNEAFYKNYKQAKNLEQEFICLLSCYEDYHEQAYKCQAGKWTVGYGSRQLADGTPVVKGTTVTRKDAAAAVTKHMEKYVYPQLRHINKELTPEQLMAVNMFIYNTDENAFRNSKVCRAINDNADETKMREAFSYYRRVNSERSYGLINRRGFEGYLWSCGNLADVLLMSPKLAGSPDIRYFEYPNARSRNPHENPDETFVVRQKDEVKRDLEKFKVSNLSQSILGNTTPEICDNLCDKYGIYEENNQIKQLQVITTDNSQNGKTIAFAQAQRLKESR